MMFNDEADQTLSLICKTLISYHFLIYMAAYLVIVYPVSYAITLIIQEVSEEFKKPISEKSTAKSWLKKFNYISLNITLYLYIKLFLNHDEELYYNNVLLYHILLQLHNC
jgi:hypothetical protein